MELLWTGQKRPAWCSLIGPERRSPCEFATQTPAAPTYGGGAGKIVLGVLIAPLHRKTIVFAGFPVVQMFCARDADCRQHSRCTEQKEQVIKHLSRTEFNSERRRFGM